MFDNLFTNQHRFNYSKPSDNENDNMLDLNMIVNIDDDIDEIWKMEERLGDCVRETSLKGDRKRG